MMEYSEFTRIVIQCVADARQVLPWLGTYVRGEGGDIKSEDGTLAFTPEKAYDCLLRIEKNLTEMREAVPEELDYVTQQIRAFLKENDQL